MVEGFCLDIPAGSFAGIVGKSGVRKSTLFALASGLCETDFGFVSLDGVSVGCAPHEWLCAQVGAVEQQAVLMSGSILDAILYGAPAGAVRAHDFISKLPDHDGYDTQDCG